MIEQYKSDHKKFGYCDSLPQFNEGNDQHFLGQF